MRATAPSEEFSVTPRLPAPVSRLKILLVSISIVALTFGASSSTKIY